MTPRQHELLTFIRGYIAENGYSPSLSEMRDALGLSSKSGPHRMLAALRRDGFIANAAHGAGRSAVIVETFGALDPDQVRRQRDVAYRALVDIRDSGRTRTFQTAASQRAQAALDAISELITPSRNQAHGSTGEEEATNAF